MLEQNLHGFYLNKNIYGKSAFLCRVLALGIITRLIQFIYA